MISVSDEDKIARMKIWLSFFFQITILLLLSAGGLAGRQEQTADKLPATDLERVKPGGEAPDFTLEDQDGRLVTLSSFRDKKTVVLVFYRGYW